MWVYLCSNPRRLDITLRFLPAEFPLTRLCVCWLSHLDPPDRGKELWTVLEKHMHPRLEGATVHDLSRHAEECPAPLRLYFDNEKPRWSLGAKLLLPLIFAPPFLYTDDDVLVLDDPMPLMQEGFGSCNFPFFKGDLRKQPLINALSDAFGRPTTMEEYDKHILDAGIFFVPADTRYTDWRWRLDRFAKLPYIQGLDPTSHEFRRLDQRFLTMWGLTHGWKQLRHAHERRNALSAPSSYKISSLVKDTVFVHYMTGTYKQAWMNTLEQYLEGLHGQQASL